MKISKGVLLALCTILPLRLEGQTPIRYRIEVSIDRSMDLSATRFSAGIDERGQPQVRFRHSEVAVILSVLAKDSAGGKLLRLTIDSVIQIDPSVLTVDGEAASPRGQLLVAVVTGGKWTILSAVTTGEQLAGAVLTALPLFYQSRRSGASSLGPAWTDSVVTESATSEAGTTATQRGMSLIKWNPISRDSLSARLESSGWVSMSDKGAAKEPTLGTFETSASGEAFVRLSPVGALERGVLKVESQSGSTVTGMGTTKTVVRSTTIITRVVE